MKQRPISPHLSVYKPMITSMSSIIGRFCGIYLYLITFIIFSLAAYCVKNFNSVSLLLDAILSFGQSHIVNKIILIMFTLFTLFAFIFYLLAILRHLVWDFGYGLELKTSKIMGYTMFLFAGIASALLTCYIFLI